MSYRKNRNGQITVRTVNNKLSKAGMFEGNKRRKREQRIATECLDWISIFPLKISAQIDCHNILNFALRFLKGLARHQFLWG